MTTATNFVKEIFKAFVPTGDKLMKIPTLDQLKQMVAAEKIEWQDEDDPYCGNFLDDQITCGESCYYVLLDAPDYGEISVAIGSLTGTLFIS